jgi:Putative 2OG-Fe(II) oxygenase
MSIFHKITSSVATNINSEIFDGFLQQKDNEDIHKTHLFGGRYENIYMTEKHIPQLKILMEEAISHAGQILDVTGLRAGYWFNDMPPGASTTLHTHDDDDELLSAVYYVYVPEDSGNLIIYDDRPESDGKKIEIQSRTGDFIFFKPDVRHEVSKNNSAEHRLSIGINFGLDNDRTG